MIALFTDFGTRGPYLGQMRALLHHRAPGVPVVDLVSDAPTFDPRAAACLLDAVRRPFPDGTVFLGVVDPGVGTREREPVVLHAHRCWFVGPGNGLFDRVAAGDPRARAWRIDPVADDAAPTFHGRDVFAPAAAALALGEPVPGVAVDRLPGAGAVDEALEEVIYVDDFGNAWTGVEAATLPSDAQLLCAGHTLGRARTFGEVRPGTAFWYENSSGLAEIAVNRGDASGTLGLTVGTPVRILSGES